MRSASVPVDESARLAALRRYAILDTAPEESFDRFVRLVAAILEVDGAVISFVDADRQWFKARVGVARQQTPRSVAFCAHAILDDGPLIVLDATQDERFYDNPLVVEKNGIRFYAGMPVRTPDGFAVGVLCAVDTKPHPRPPSPAQIAALRELACLVADELELRRTMALLNTELERRRAAEAQVRELAYRDTLTGLLNRRSFNEHLARRLARVDDRTAGALLLIDLDHFKDINDVIGHDAGDALLKAIAHRLQAEVRSRQDIVARLGGDEFAVILGDLADDTVNRTAQPLLETCAKPVPYAGQLIHCSASIGVTIFPKDGVASPQILKNADVALYKSKSTGRRVVSFFDPEMMAETVARTQIIEELRQAIAERQLRLAYQPIFELSGRRRRVGFEALVRWEHPQRGILPPSAFLEAATLAGLDSDLCAFTVDAAARQVREWLDQGIDPGYVAINMSAAELRDDAAPARVMAAIAANRLQPRHLEVEITENVVIAHDRKVEAALEALHEGGFRIALDDFGTGYSSLVHLKQLPVDVLKIDQSFVRDMERDVENATIANTIVRLAHSLDLTVVAEGIETEAQLTRLRRMGCERGQGYLLAEPAFAADLAKHLSEPRPRSFRAA